MIKIKRFVEEIEYTYWEKKLIGIDKSETIVSTYQKNISLLYEQYEQKIHQLISENNSMSLIEKACELIDKKISGQFEKILNKVLEYREKFQNENDKIFEIIQKELSLIDKLTLIVKKLIFLRKNDKEQFNTFIEKIGGEEIFQRMLEFLEKLSTKTGCLKILPVLHFSCEKKIFWQDANKNFVRISKNDVCRSLFGQLCILPSSVIIGNKKISAEKLNDQKLFEESYLLQLFIGIDKLKAKKTHSRKTSNQLLNIDVKEYLSNSPYCLPSETTELLKGCTINAFAPGSELLRNEYPQFNALLITNDHEAFVSQIDTTFRTKITMGLDVENNFYSTQTKRLYIYKKGDENKIYATYESLWHLRLENFVWDGFLQLINIKISPELNKKEMGEVKLLFDK